MLVMSFAMMMTIMMIVLIKKKIALKKGMGEVRKRGKEERGRKNENKKALP